MHTKPITVKYEFAEKEECAYEGSKLCNALNLLLNVDDLYDERETNTGGV